MGLLKEIMREINLVRCIVHFPEELDMAIPRQLLRVQRNIKLLVLYGIYSGEKILRNYNSTLESMPLNFGTFTAIP
jgi:hypothetical protein